MKSRLIIFSLMIAGVAVSASAQEKKEKFVGEKASDNIFLSVGVGANASMYKEDGFSLGDAISPHITISLGKWITPTWGFRGQVGFWKDNIFTGYGEAGDLGKNASDAILMEPGTKQGYDIVNGRLRLDGMLNLSTLFCGYNPKRVFNLSVFAGPGLTIANTYTEYGRKEIADATGTTAVKWQKTGESKSVRTYINGSVGLQAKFNVSKYWDIDLEARGELSPSIAGQLTPYDRTTGTLFLTAGATYTFGGKKFIPVTAKVDIDALNAEINKYKEQYSQAAADAAANKNALATAEKELAAAKNALANVKPTTTEAVVTGAIFFRIGSARLDDYGKVNIELAAKAIKASPDKKFTVRGYADKATGSKSWNQTLSEKRAQAVYDALVAQGVSKDQLTMDPKGGTDNMFGKNYLNRVVILE
jgi:outer membrane protein OmpA-like peptidoglycan-associated protein